MYICNLISRYVKYSAFVAATLLVLLSTVRTSQAQMFSVSSSPDQPGSVFQVPNSITAGLEFSDFSYFGPRGDDLPDTIYDFNGAMYTLRYESGSLSLYISDRTSLGPEDDIRATRIGIGLQSLAPIAVGSRARYAIPFALNTDYTLVRTSETANTGDEFAQNSIYLQSGLDILLRITGNTVLQTVTAPHIGYTVGQLGSSGGVSYKLRQDVRFSVNNIYSGFGLIAGYTFQFSRFSNSDRQFRYDLMSHSVLLGFTF